MRIIVQRIASLRKRDSEVAGYKVIIIQNSIAFLYTSNGQLEFKIKIRIPFILV